MTMKQLATTFVMALAIGLDLMAVPFGNMRFDQEINVQSINAMNEAVTSTNGTTLIGSKKGDFPEQEGTDDITFHVGEKGGIKFILEAEEDDTEVIGRVSVNGKPLKTLIAEQALEAVNVNNPLWRRKLAIVGDSLTMNPYPADGKRYVDYISERNNMVLVNKGMSGRQLCNSTQTVPSLISTYSTDIPSDADFILCQIGANDVSKKWATAQGNDTDMTTDTFKGCWNLLLVGMKTQFPNAKVGIILAHNWRDNLGEKSEMAITNNARRAMTQWQKIQCQKLNIPVFDPVEDTRFFTYNLKVYEGAQDASIETLNLDWYDQIKQQIGTLQLRWQSAIGGDQWEGMTPTSGWISHSQYLRDTQHQTDKGSKVLSWYIEDWMKKVLSSN